MDKLYRETKENLLSLNEILANFELCINNEEIEAIKSRINLKFDEIRNSCNQLDNLVLKEPANRRYDAKIKIDQLKYDFSHYNQAFKQINYKKEQKFLEIKRREELLNSEMRSSNHYNNNGHVQFNIDGFQSEIRHHNRLSNFNNEIDQMIDHGENVLKHIQNQNDFLKDVKRKILNVTNSLGLSNSLIGIIERRNTSDKYVLFGGMIITCVIMFLTLKYLY